MFRTLFFGSLGAAVVLALAGCSTAGTNDFIKIAKTLHQDGCHVTVNASAQAGAVNPGSGIMFQGNVDCPAATPAPSPTPAPTPAAPAANFAPH